MMEEQIEKCGYKTDSDVHELYLGRKGLREVTDLSRFRMLKYLWLNHNKISRVNFLTTNFRLSELYLDHNELCDIKGSLKHLTSLHTLMLNDNHLTKLQAAVQELKRMTNLRVLNLFHNPLEQDTGYRAYVVQHLPSLELLDREQVRQKEREEAFKLFNPERTAVLQSLGFGRRTDSALGGRPAMQGSASSCRSMERSGEPGNCDVTCVSDREDVLPFEDQALLRGYRRSVTQFSLVDWSKMPASFQKRTADQPCHPPPLMTVEFRTWSNMFLALGDVKAAPVTSVQPEIQQCTSSTETCSLEKEPFKPKTEQFAQEENLLPPNYFTDYSDLKNTFPLESRNIALQSSENASILLKGPITVHTKRPIGQHLIM
ncbi:PREDICTED: leucine-rich repeat-containing protein 72 [Nanorana parkeri]|uniref:leucine-rich repeat-containing protein 72 n=1 Tax=Nanorana parkeri TaxID=125878 RepID=UPI00085455BB|nr:PREDICTED: leucine-rich repeat-containing protein 72 [Nanorana parkeri]